MGLENFIKRQAGIGRLPDNQINELTVAQVLKTGAPFVVYLPIWDTERSYSGSSLSMSMGNGARQTVYHRDPGRKVQRHVKTLVTYNLEQLTIQHAQKNGKHIIIKTKKIAKVGKGTDGVQIELVDGLIYKFIMDKDIKNRWKQLGFNPQFPIDVFYNLLSGQYIRELQQKYQTTDMNEIMEKANQAVNGVPQEPSHPTKKSEVQKTKKTRKRKTKKKDIGTEESPMEKIKEAKELFDMGAITQEEFDKIKSKYIDQF